MDAMLDHLNGKASVYEVEYRIQAKDGKYRWYYDLGKIAEHDDSGKPLVVAGIVFDITEKKETQLDLEHKNEILAEMSVIDGLTKISNYRALIEHLKGRMAYANRINSPLCIALFDIDDFKKVNDSKGHICGNNVIVDIAEIFKNYTRDSDFVGRYGGEEFMVIFSDTDLATGEKKSNRDRQAVENHPFAEGVKITISGGIQQFDGESLIELIDLADKHLYEAKKNGKNQIAS